MQDKVTTTSWMRSSDGLPESAEAGMSYRARARRVREQEAQQLEAWVNEGGNTARATGPVRILIVDNDIGSAGALELRLRASGYSETRVAYSGHAALAIAADFQPNVVLLELELLDMDGYALAQSLREQAQGEDVRLIALTSSREHAGRERARVAGFERYLLKPVTAVDLADLLERPT
jgi:CheY-like chemotaxis protein